MFFALYFRFGYNLVQEMSTELYYVKQGRTRVEAAGLQPPQTPQNRNLRNRDSVDIMISKVLRDLTFIRNQTLKSADD